MPPRYIGPPVRDWSRRYIGPPVPGGGKQYIGPPVPGGNGLTPTPMPAPGPMPKTQPPPPPVPMPAPGPMPKTQPPIPGGPPSGGPPSLPPSVGGAIGQGWLTAFGEILPQMYNPATYGLGGYSLPWTQGVFAPGLGTDVTRRQDVQPPVNLPAYLKLLQAMGNPEYFNQLIAYMKRLGGSQVSPPTPGSEGGLGDTRR